MKFKIDRDGRGGWSGEEVEGYDKSEIGPNFLTTSRCHPSFVPLSVIPFQLADLSQGPICLRWVFRGEEFGDRVVWDLLPCRFVYELIKGT